MMGQLAEVLLPEPEERGAIELGVAADPLVGVRVQLLAGLVAPLLRGLVLPLDVDGASAPVVQLARHVVAALEHQDALAGSGQAVRERAAAGTGPDDDDVVVG
jgi:hypothetical protein